MNLHGLYSYNVIDSIASIRLKHKLFRHLWALFVHENQTIIIFATPLSFTLVHYVETDKRIFKKFSPSGSHAILVFAYQTAWQYSDGNPANLGVECTWGNQKSRFWANIWLHCVLCSVPSAGANAIHSWDQRPLAGTDHGEFSLRQSLVSGRVCWWRETTTKCMTRSLNVTPKTTLRTGKSEA